MTSQKPSLIVLDDIKDFVIPLTADEFSHLEKSITEGGCRDSLIVWRKGQNQLVIVDGHNRYQICQKHNLPFSYKCLDFRDIEHVKLWMIENQIGRRNLTQDQLSYYRGLKYLALKKKKGGFDNVRLSGQSANSTSFQLSKEFNVSASTIKRDGKFAQALNIVAKLDPKLKIKILTGELSVKKVDIESLPTAKNPETRLNEIIKKGPRPLEEDARRSNSIAVDGYQDKFRNMRTRIINIINKLIVNRNPEDVKELKLLVATLEQEVLAENNASPKSLVRHLPD